MVQKKGDDEMSLMEIQKKLNVPKARTNSFGKYKYRSCEDILEAVKPLLYEHGFYLILSDEVVDIAGKAYVKATAHLFDSDKITKFIAHGYARESQEKKGMDDSQMTGTASSYARKYALNGLFAIDDTKDADTDEFRNESKQAQKKSPKPEAKPEYTAKQIEANRDAWIKLFDSKKATPDDIINKIKAEYTLDEGLELDIRNLEAAF
jgi:hypothetical protein